MLSRPRPRRTLPPSLRKWAVLVPLLLAVILIVTWQVVRADAPTPNAPIPNPSDVDYTANGPAPSLHGSPLQGRILFVANCARCHGDLGVGGVDNPGSDDGTIPPLNPIDPGFVDDSHGDPGIFARDIDLFLQHGSEPSGDNPALQMPAWGDKKLMTPAQLADVEAYVMQLNGIYWPDRWYPPAEVQMDAHKNGNTVTYTINIVNHGSSPLGELNLRDTLPPGLALISSQYFGLGNNPGKVDGSTVEWDVADLPSGETAGPFTLVTGLTGKDVPANVAQITFTFCTWDNNCMPASQVSDRVVPAAPAAVQSPPAVVVTAPTAAPTTAQPAANPTAEATASATTPEATAVATAVPTSTPAPTTAPVVQALRPSNGNLTGGAALDLTGDAANGNALYAQKCKGCHGDQGKGGVANPGSTDGVIPALNPVNALLKSADLKTFAYNLDLFIEHGSKPQGSNPLATMPAWGDTHLLMPQQIADLIAYIISLNP